ncbi:uncharacterized protein LOC107223872 [Neodiprion lecontei]|uniref:Uncharacterized protein LOC107223872 n=1 Tax=Neodiprion lecontei TaxID=441921 RepID=A0A6J0BY55_NEOLC|nr:uncharacterized protein LOC107223872 [Neodiprion lecontei]
MRAVGMLRSGFILVFLIITYANTLPLQYLPSIPGYVPVYIRNGDEPLEDINLALAEAFAEHSSSKNLKESPIALDALQPVDYEQVSNGVDKVEKSIPGAFELNELGAEQKNDDANAEVLSLDEPAPTAVQRRETNRSDGEKKSEAVTLEVNRSRIPQLLTAQEHEDEQTSEAEKVPPISLSEESANELNSVPANETEDSDKLGSEEKSDQFKPTDAADLNPNYPELPAEIPQQHNSQDFGTPAEGHPEVNSPMIIMGEINTAESVSEHSSSLSNGNKDNFESSGIASDDSAANVSE